jgi:hypothetical protein
MFHGNFIAMRAHALGRTKALHCGVGILAETLRQKLGRVGPASQGRANCAESCHKQPRIVATRLFSKP